MRKGCNVCKILDTLPKKQSSPGLENGLNCNTEDLVTYKETNKFRTGPTSIERKRLRDEFTLVIHTSVHMPDRGFCVTNAHLGSFYMSRDLKEQEAQSGD